MIDFEILIKSLCIVFGTLCFINVIIVFIIIYFEN